jgi:hypothetical protein
MSTYLRRASLMRLVLRAMITRLRGLSRPLARGPPSGAPS